jgi:hypothetical protein
VTARRYITDQWIRVPPTKVDQPTIVKHELTLGELKLRHWLFFVSIALLAISPLIWILADNSGPFFLSVGFGGLLFGLSALLVPSKLYKINDER